VGFVEAAVEPADARIAVVGPLALGIIVVDEEAETQSGAGGSPFEHLEIAVGVSKGGDGPAADVLLDGDRFVGLIIAAVLLSW